MIPCRRLTSPTLSSNIREAMDDGLREDQLKKRTADAVAKVIQPYITLLSENLDRISNLVDIYFSQTAENTNDRCQDILRGAVVLMHATLEDELRTLGANILPKADEGALNDIPLKGITPAGRPEKFYLGTLAKHRGKTVDEVIAESVMSHLGRSNFNNVQDVVGYLRILGLNASEYEEYYPKLESMMARRHQIVHCGDRRGLSGQELAVVQPMVAQEVLEWMRATSSFLSKVIPDGIMKSRTASEWATEIGVQLRDP